MPGKIYFNKNNVCVNKLKNYYYNSYTHVFFSIKNVDVVGNIFIYASIYYHVSVCL